MAVRIRLKRLGRRNRPFYRIVAMDSRSPRDGRALEVLGHYDPYVEDFEKGVDMKEDRIRHWLSVGARPSETVASFIVRRGIQIPWEKKHLSTEELRAKRERKKRVKVSKPKPKKQGVSSTKTAKKVAEERAAELKKLSKAEKKQMEKA